jgi:hypothetical protein
MANRPEKITPKTKKTMVKSEADHFEDVTRKLFKVHKSEIVEKGKKP